MRSRDHGIYFSKTISHIGQLSSFEHCLRKNEFDSVQWFPHVFSQTTFAILSSGKRLGGTPSLCKMTD